MLHNGNGVNDMAAVDALPRILHNNQDHRIPEGGVSLPDVTMKLHKPQRLGSDPCRARAPHAPCARSDGRANPHGNQILSAPAICAAISFLQLGKSEWAGARSGFGTENVEKKLRVHIGMKE